MIRMILMTARILMSSDIENNDVSVDNSKPLDEAQDALTDSVTDNNDVNSLDSDTTSSSSESESDFASDLAQADIPPLKANKKVKAPRRGGGFFTALSFLLALAALALSLFTYWQQREVTQTAGVDLTAVEESSATLKREVQTELKSYLNTFTADSDKLVNDITRSNRKAEQALKLDVEELSARLAVSEDQIVTLRGFSDAAKYAYVKAEIEYFLQTANNRIDLAKDSSTALAALEAADQRLGLLSDPSLRRVRAQVLDEIQALKAVEQVDIELIALTLSSIAKQVHGLPLRMDDEKDYYQEEIKLKPGSGFKVGMSNVWRSMKGTLDKLVEVRDATPSDVPLMKIEDLNLLYVNLDIQLQSARLASLKGDANNYKISIESAMQLLKDYFDTESPKVNALIKSLNDIKEANLSPELPDITQSLLMLRKLRSADNADTESIGNE